MKKIGQKEAWFSAVKDNDIKTIQRMIEDGFDVDTKSGINNESTNGWTVLHEACSFGSIEMTKLLIRNGANVNIQNQFFSTPLHFACHWGYCNIVRVLLKNGADVNVVNQIMNTPLHETCYSGDISTIKLLLSKGADITIKNNDGETPLDDLKARHPQKYEELIEWLAEYHPDKTLELMSNDKAQDKGVVGL